MNDVETAKDPALRRGRIGGLVAIALAASLATGAAPPPQRLGDAVEQQRALAHAHPDDPAAWNDLGNLLVVAGRLEEARETYQRALASDPGNASANYNLGLLLQQLGERRKARNHFEEVLRLEPDHAWAHYQLGILFAGSRQEAAAVRHYARAFALDPQLAFPDVNPHIVENPLAARALLKAHRREPAAPLAPRDYRNPARIAGLLLPPPEASSSGPDAADQRAAEQAEEAGRPTWLPTTPGAPGYSEAGGGGDRVLTPQDLTSSRVGQATPSGGAPAVGVPGGRVEPVRPGGRTRQPIGGQRSEPGVAYGVPVFRPAEPSTGRLDVELLPDGRTPGATEPAP